MYDLPLVFKNNNVMQATSQKDRGIILDTRLSFKKYLETVLCKKERKLYILSVSCWVSYPDQFWSYCIKPLFPPPWLCWYFLWSNSQCIVLLEIKVSLIQCLFSYYWSNMWFIKRQTMPRTRPSIFTTTLLV